MTTHETNSMFRFDLDGDDEKLSERERKLVDELRTLTAKDVAKLKEAFALFDRDGSGSIDEEELLEIFVSLDPRITKAEFKELVKEYDADGDGNIDWEEFCVLMKPAILGMSGEAGQTMSDADIRAAFDIADADGGGSIDKQELGQLLASLGERMSDEDLSALFDEIDEDASGAIDFGEFKELLLALTAESDDEDGSAYTWVTASDQQEYEDEDEDEDEDDDEDDDDEEEEAAAAN